ncbi:triosephosphate isomerase [Azospirillum sp. TSH100]|uniref:triose-phosphate isomerase n=1 Tax=Azospirillum sp. TSH100 TaxID=652764 RepID=UPI000D604F64|nr:triose-phosphate isomerase [Azospirillum sp. TSH100]PWC82073.1 triosephosphate isomerase [Azospirillum sp. TSH100]QCG88031.1 triose-phosphate isomerase [Azospirillum sp. TSH100]
MTANRKLIAGNWKMNGLKADGLDLASDLAGRLKGAGPVAFDMLVCPPFPLLFPVGEAIADSPLALGGQDCAPKTSGAHTGDVAPTMLKDAGCRFVILGHSERRADHGESDAVVNAKAVAAHKEGLVAIICVGETETQRDAGQADAVVSGQLAGSIPAGATAENTVIAYEPVWAIGTGKTATPDDVKAMHAHIRAELDGKIAESAKVRILYGGSVKPNNAAELMAVENVDGALVGGASLKADDFWAIATACR